MPFDMDPVSMDTASMSTDTRIGMGFMAIDTGGGMGTMPVDVGDHVYGRRNGYRNHMSTDMERTWEPCMIGSEPTLGSCLTNMRSRADRHAIRHETRVCRDVIRVYRHYIRVDGHDIRVHRHGNGHRTHVCRHGGGRHGSHVYRHGGTCP